MIPFRNSFPHPDGPVKVPRYVKWGVSDPWDLSGELLAGSSRGYRYGHVVELQTSSDGSKVALMKLATPLLYRNVSYEWLVASNRYKGEQVSDLLSSVRIGAAACVLTQARPIDFREMVMQEPPPDTIACLCEIVPL